MSETSYGAGYPFAIEAVYSQRLGDVQARINKWVTAATLKTYRAIARSGAVINADAYDGKDINANEYLGEMLKGKALKEAKQYLKAKGGKTYSRMSRDQQKKLLDSIADIVLPNITQAIAMLKAVKGEGVYGDAPAFTMAEVGRAIGLAVVSDMEKTIKINGEPYRRAINVYADKIQDEITGRNFSLTSDYWGDFHQRHYIEKFPLTNITKRIPATPDVGGAVLPYLQKTSDTISTAASALSLDATNRATNQLYDEGAHNFRLIVKAAQDVDIADEIDLLKENLGDLISIDIYDGDEKLVKQTSAWLESTMGKMENVTDDALQRGIKTMQRGLMEGRSVDHIAAQLESEMGIPWRRARNVARNEIGNQSWNLEEANARRGNMRFYLWHGMLDERERKLHVERENKAYEPTRPPSDGNPGQPHGCRCFPEWVFSREGVKKAEEEIAKRMAKLTH